MAESEVARLMQQIAAEYSAAQAGMSGLAVGVSQHKFITARMENIGQCHEQLTTLVGSEQATRILAETLDNRSS